MLRIVISRLPVMTAMLQIFIFLTYNLMETVEAKLGVNVAKSVDTTFSQETGERFVSPAPLLKPCLAFLRPLHAF